MGEDRSDRWLARRSIHKRSRPQGVTLRNSKERGRGRAVNRRTRECRLPLPALFCRQERGVDKERRRQHAAARGERGGGNASKSAWEGNDETLVETPTHTPPRSLPSPRVQKPSPAAALPTLQLYGRKRVYGKSNTGMGDRRARGGRETGGETRAPGRRAPGRRTTKPYCGPTPRRAHVKAGEAGTREAGEGGGWPRGA